MKSSTLRGVTVMEVITALAVLTILLTAALGGEETQRQAIADAFDRLAADVAVSSRLEGMHAGKLVPTPGRRSVALGPQGGRAEEEVRELAEGLYEVRLRVCRPDGVVLADVRTRIAREVRR